MKTLWTNWLTAVMSKKVLVASVFVVTVLFLGISLNFPKKVEGKLDLFAKCLADKEVTMYGAAWCSHCQNEKAAFGNSFKFVPYVECPENPKECLAKEVKSYPTWIFPDERRFVGEQGLKKLSDESGCALPQKNQ